MEMGSTKRKTGIDPFKPGAMRPTDITGERYESRDVRMPNFPAGADERFRAVMNELSSNDEFVPIPVTATDSSTPGLPTKKTEMASMPDLAPPTLTPEYEKQLDQELEMGSDQTESDDNSPYAAAGVKAGGETMKALLNSVAARHRQQRQIRAQSALQEGRQAQQVRMQQGASEYGALQKLMQSYRSGLS